MKKIFAVLSFLGLILLPLAGSAALNPQVDRFSDRTYAYWDQLVTCDDSSAVYYIGHDAKRYAFPNDRAFFTYYPDFSDVRRVRCEDLADFSLGGLVTYNPGTRYVKFQTENTVYAVEPGGILRAVPDEEWMETFVGESWSGMIDDISDAFYSTYTMGEPLDLMEIPDGMTAKDPTSGIWYYFVDGQPQSLDGISFAFKGNGHFRNFTRLKSEAPRFYERVEPALQLAERIGSSYELRMGSPWFWGEGSDTGSWTGEDDFPRMRLY